MIHHNDAGSQYTSIAFGERLAEACAAPSVGSVGDAYGNALAESLIGLFKTELIKPGRPWRAVEQVEIATRKYLDWFNHRRLFEACGDVPPAALGPPTTVNTPPSPRSATQLRKPPDTPERFIFNGPSEHGQSIFFAITGSGIVGRSTSSARPAARRRPRPSHAEPARTWVARPSATLPAADSDDHRNGDRIMMSLLPGSRPLVSAIRGICEVDR